MMMMIHSTSVTVIAKLKFVMKYNHAQKSFNHLRKFKSTHDIFVAHIHDKNGINLVTESHWKLFRKFFNV